MQKGRIPAQVDFLVSKAGINLCGTDKNSEIHNSAPRAAKQPVPRKKNPGNNCFHKKNDPDFWTPPKHCEARSILVEKIMEELEKVYFDPRHSFTEAQRRNDKQIRSELRQIIIEVLRLCVYYMDDETLRVGRKIKGYIWDDLSVKKIAKRLNVSFDRVKDALTHIYKCGYLFVKRQYKTTATGKKIWLPSMRVLTPKLFIDLKIKYEKIFKLKQYKEEQRIKKEMKAEKKESRVNDARVAQDFIKSCFETSQKSLSKPRIEIPTQPAQEKSKSASEWLKNITASLKPSPS